MTTPNRQESAAETLRAAALGDAHKALSLDATCAIGEMTEHEWFSASRPLFHNLARFVLSLAQGSAPETEREAKLAAENEALKKEREELASSLASTRVALHQLKDIQEDVVQEVQRLRKRVTQADDRDNRWIRERNEARAATAEATDRAEKAERELHAAKTLEGITDKERDQLREELATTRAATDKTSQRADALVGKLLAVERWALNLQAEADKWNIPAWQSMSAEVLALCGRESDPLPLPPKET